MRINDELLHYKCGADTVLSPMTTTNSIQVAAAEPVEPGQLLIDGQLTEAHSGRTFDVMYPGTGDRLTACAEGGPEDIEDAVAAARRAFLPWSKMKPSDRGRRLKCFADLIDQHSTRLAKLTTLEMGKPRRESETVDGPHTAMVFRYFGEWCNKVYGETCPVDPAYLNYTMKVPLGWSGPSLHGIFPF